MVTEIAICTIANFNNKAFKNIDIDLSKYDKSYFKIIIFINFMTLFSIYNKLGLTDDTINYMYDHIEHNWWSLILPFHFILEASDILELFGCLLLILRVLKLLEYGHIPFIGLIDTWIKYIIHIFDKIKIIYEKVTNGIKRFTKKNINKKS